jgi:tol-pal system protein YbgF
MRLHTICILLALLAAPTLLPGQEEQATNAGGQEASDFVIGLHALNRQIIDSLEQQPGRRVIVLQFICDKEGNEELCSYITDQLVTALAATRKYESVDPAPLAELIKGSGCDPMTLGSNPGFRQSARSFPGITVIAGKVTPLGTRYGVMARMFNAESGRLVGGAQVYLAASLEIATLTGRKFEPATEGEMPRPLAQPEENKPATEEEVAVEPSREEVAEGEPVNEPTAVETLPPAGLEGRSDKSIYDEAYSDYESGRFTRAVMLFDYVVSKFPESPLADNALYWIAESLYSRKRWAEALTGFQRVQKEYPYGNKVPAALLKVAYTEEKLGHLPEATAALQELVTRFENSAEAELGKRKLQLLRAAQQ